MAKKAKHSLPSATQAASVTPNCNLKVLNNCMILGLIQPPIIILIMLLLTSHVTLFQSPVWAQSCCNSAEEAIHCGANFVADASRMIFHSCSKFLCSIDCL